MLLVERDPTERRRMGGWLEEAGFGVETCPGPTHPDFTCIGGRTGSCPLAAAADVVVLNLRLASDEAMQGTPGWHLLTVYIELGKPVVALVSEDDPVHPRPGAGVAVLARFPAREELLDAVRRSLAGSPRQEFA